MVEVKNDIHIQMASVTISQKVQ